MSPISGISRRRHHKCCIRDMKKDLELASEQIALTVAADGVDLAADVRLPHQAHGLVIFAHGSGSSRHSPRNKYVAGEINEGRIGTMLIDLLTENEEMLDERTAQSRFNIGLLATRLVGIADWIGQQRRFAKLSLGYFGVSTGAAAALQAAAARPNAIQAVVSRGGRPDLAGAALHRVVAPTLFTVGGEDHTVLDLNRQAIAKLPQSTVSKLEVIPGATHLFEEPGALREVAKLARPWFWGHLVPKR